MFLTLFSTIASYIHIANRFIVHLSALRLILALRRCFVFYMNHKGASKVPNLALKSGANQLAIYCNPADRYGRHDNTAMPVAKGS